MIHGDDTRATPPSRPQAGDGWSFLPVYSSYTDLVGLSHGRMPCLQP